MLYKARNEVVKFRDYYSLMMSEAKTKARATKEQDLIHHHQNKCFKYYQ